MNLNPTRSNIQSINGLVNYWPIFNEQKFDSFTGFVNEYPLSNDYSGKSNIHSEKSMFTQDRFGNVNSALCPNGYNLTIPSGFYFSNESFTFSLWIKHQNFNSNAKIIKVFNIKNDSSNTLIDTVEISQSNTGIPFLKIQQANEESHITQADTSFELNVWQFFVVTLNGTNAKMYLNGKIISEDSDQFIPVNTYHKYAYIGLNSDSVYDEIMIYNRSLSFEEIIDLMNTSDGITPLNTEIFLKKHSLLKKRSVVMQENTKDLGEKPLLSQNILANIVSFLKEILRFV